MRVVRKFLAFFPAICPRIPFAALPAIRSPPLDPQFHPRPGTKTALALMLCGTDVDGALRPVELSSGFEEIKGRS